jgi:hypothetical protein
MSKPGIFVNDRVQRASERQAGATELRPGLQVVQVLGAVRRDSLRPRRPSEFIREPAGLDEAPVVVDATADLEAELPVARLEPQPILPEHAEVLRLLALGLLLQLLVPFLGDFVPPSQDVENLVRHR